MHRELRGLAAGAMVIAVAVAGCTPPVSVRPMRSKSTPVSAPPAVTPWQGRFVDLTHPYDDATIYWPTAEHFRLRRDAAGVTEKGYYYASNTLTTSEHGGTHIDAPIHFFQEGTTVDRIPLTQLIAPAVVVDVREQCAADRDYQIGVADLRAWEERHGRQLVDVVVLLRTGFSQHWPDAQKYLGTTERGAAAVAQLHFPGLDPAAARWLVEQRAPLAVGIDTASIDFGQSTHYESHVTLFKHGVPALENVDLTADLPEIDFSVIALPMKIAGGSGGPTRIVAVVPENEVPEDK
jgi:kynurenine formamidase